MSTYIGVWAKPTLVYQADIDPGTEHEFRIRAKNSGGIGRWSERSIKWTLPGIPQNIITEPTSQSIQIIWELVTGASGYDIEVYGTAVDAGALEGYLHSGINPNNQQTYRVRAKNSSGVGEWSAYVAGTTLPGRPAYIRPEPDDTGVTVYWEPISGALTYDIEADGSIIEGLEEPIYRHLGLEPNTVHAYRIRSNSPAGTSDWSDPVECATRFSPPANINAIVSSGQIKLTWEEAEGAEGYDVEADGQILSHGNHTLYLHTGLLPDTQHIYRVRAKNSAINGIWSQPLVKTTLLGVPQSIQGELASTQITVKWDMVSGAVAYDVEADGQIIENGLSTVYRHSGLEPFTSHTYRVRVWNREGAGEWSELTEWTTLVGIPSGIVTSSTTTEINIGWDEVTGAEGYDIMVDGEIFNNGSNISYCHTNIEPNSSHLYQVRAKRGAEPGEWSEAVSGRTLVGTPMGVDAKALSREIELAWDEVSGAAGYEVEINDQTVADVEENSYLQTGVDPNSLYRIRVRAKNELGSGEWSDYLECTTAPDMPSGLEALETVTEITLTWEEMEGAVSYDIEADGVIISDINATSYTHSELKSNTRHSYRIRSKNEYSTSPWSDVLLWATTPEVFIPTQRDVIFNFVIVAPQKQGVNERTIVVTYNPEELEVFDLCALTPEPETTTGQIEGTNIHVEEFEPGRIVYRITHANRTVVQVVKFLSNTSGHSRVTYTIQ